MVDGPDSIGKYRVIKHLATGGMGEVFLARQDGLRGFTKLVVVKRLLSQYARDPGFLEMFLNEARLAAQLHHPNIAQVFDLGEEQGNFFIAMEFVHGATLRLVRQKLAERGRTLEPRLAAFLCAQALNGLQHAHTLTDDAGQPLRIVHRDISPDNLLVGFDGVVKVVDFGIAKATSGASTTTTGTVKGKFAYMAPEYLSGEAIDGRADVYSMGVVLYELLSGARPFRGGSDPALIMAIMRDAPPPLRERAPMVPPGLEAIVGRALVKDPARRFQSAQQMAVELERFAAGQVTASQLQPFLAELLGPEASRRPTGEQPVQVVASGEPVAAETVTRARPAAPPPGWLAKTQPVDPAMVPPRREAVPTSGMPTTAAPAFEPAAPAVATVLAPALEPTSALSPSQVEVVPPGRGRVVGAAVLVGVFGLSGWLLLRGSEETTREEVVAVPVVTVDAGAAAIAPVIAPVIAAEAPVIAPMAEPVAAIAPAALDAGEPAAAVVPVVRAEAKTGRVNLVVLPWAEVRFGGAMLGVTPLDELTLPKGLQTLQLTNPELGVTKKVQVRVPAGGVTTVKVDLMAD